MAFYIEHRHRAPATGKASNHVSRIECLAEELLDGLLCHYEPPENKFLLEPGDDMDLEDPLELRRPPSILKKTSSFNRKKKRKKKGRLVRFSGVHFRCDSSNNSSKSRPKFLQRFAIGRKGSF